MKQPAKVAYRARWYRAHDKLDLADALELELAEAKRCRYCGRELSDPASIEVGAGADCLAKRAKAE